MFLLAAEAGGLADTSRYPMAFDEGYHFTLIQFFAHHLNPIVTSQPASSYGLGALAHNPSFLYHYLLSFPYLLDSHLSSSLKFQVISLRFINLGLMIVSLIFAYKILRQLKFSKALANIVILVFALTPLVTALAAQINYDNLVILLSTVSVYMALRLHEQARAGKLKFDRIAWLITIALFGSLVKFSYLPIFTGVVLVIVWSIYLHRQKRRHSLKQDIKDSWVSLKLTNKMLLISLLILGGSLFGYFYGFNLVKYHSIAPQCQQVLTSKDCSQYYVWNRNNEVIRYDRAHPSPMMSPISYSVFWFKVEYYQLFAEIVPTGGLVYIAHDYYVLIIFFSVLSALAVIFSFPKLLKLYPPLKPLMVITAIYLVALWAYNYNAYRHLGQPLAIQGRYLVPV